MAEDGGAQESFGLNPMRCLGGSGGGRGVEEREEHRDGLLAVKQRGGHEGAVLGECEWRVLAVLAPPSL